MREVCVVHVIAPLDLYLRGSPPVPFVFPSFILLSQAGCCYSSFLQGSFLDNHNTFHSQGGESKGAYHTLSCWSQEGQEKVKRECNPSSTTTTDNCNIGIKKKHTMVQGQSQRYITVCNKSVAAWENLTLLFKDDRLQTFHD